MCAINGFNFRNREVLLRMNTVTTHRGPDGTGIFSNEDVSLGHNRLSIIDLSHLADQPMVGDGGRFVITFNGEIYNYKSLRKELVDSYQFKTNSDTEVILAAYKKWGSECVNKLNGMFAFAIWDTNKKELFFARDHVGVKPFYYYFDGNCFIFSSEIKAILEHDILRKVNTEALEHYFRLMYVPEPLTMFKDIYKLPPAHRGILKNRKLTLEQYWEGGEERGESSSNRGRKTLTKQVRKSVFDAVDRQLISDKPLGVYLSGGIDSTVVLDSMSRKCGKVSTFSVGFDLKKNEGRERFNKDFNLARETAKYYQTNHHEVLLSHMDVVDLLEKVIWHTDEPISNATELAQFKLASFAKQSVDVVLGGDGGDELFGGYERYRLALLARWYQKIPHTFRSVMSISEKMEKLNIPPGIDQFELFMFQKDVILNRILPHGFVTDSTRDFFKTKYFPDNSKYVAEELLMRTDRRSWLVDESLMRTDKMGMSSGIEVRVPLLDKEIVELAHSIPHRYKVTPFNTKVILKEAFRGRIPDFLFNEPKRGWFSPGAKWLRYDEVYQFAQEVLSTGYYEETNSFFDWAEVQKILNDHYHKREYNLTILWALISFQIWAKQFGVKMA